jgi:hypothetical protein
MFYMAEYVCILRQNCYYGAAAPSTPYFAGETNGSLLHLNARMKYDALEYIPQNDSFIGLLFSF